VRHLNITDCREHGLQRRLSPLGGTVADRRITRSLARAHLLHPCQGDKRRWFEFHALGLRLPSLLKCPFGDKKDPLVTKHFSGRFRENNVLEATLGHPLSGSLGSGNPDAL
jgi:hypothetical protein